jgi:hypothetical protein
LVLLYEGGDLSSVEPSGVVVKGGGEERGQGSGTKTRGRKTKKQEEESVGRKENETSLAGLIFG